MFDSRKLLARLEALSGVDRFIVAYSGGLDSTVLLHALAAIRREKRFLVEAVHVHHGLQSEADQWELYCRRFCERLGVRYRSFWVDARSKPGESPEAAARHARYGILAPLLQASDCLLTAHHRDDQSETVLLQLLRGAGPEGLAAMPFVTGFGVGYHARPLLEYSRTELLRYAQGQELDWIDDPSNFDVDYARNFLRHELFPLLRRRWPSAAQTLCRVARIQAEASELASSLGEIDRVNAAGSKPGTLSVNALTELSYARRNNLLRYWIRERMLPVPTSRQLAQVSVDLLASRQDGMPCLRWPGAEMRRYRDDLYATPPLSAHDATKVYVWEQDRDLVIPHLNLRLSAEDLKAQTSIVPSSQTRFEVRFRRGGERCRREGRRHRYSLKTLFQDAGIPPWERDRIPLIYINDKLALVWGYWFCK
jgi:tRNA(Ile)-lysidine synthase